MGPTGRRSSLLAFPIDNAKPIRYYNGMPTSGRPSIIDLFAGVGGISLGAARAGFELKCAVELDERAMAAHRLNFPAANHVQKDISTLGGNTLLEATGLRFGQLHGLVGGPPCQGFSLIGKNLADDPRNAMLLHFCRLVGETNPSFFLFENVPGILRPRNRVVLDAALNSLPAHYTLLPPLTLDASHCGAATSRTRVFFIGFDPNRVREITELDFVPEEALSAVRVKHALAGLPAIRSAWATEAQSWRAAEKLSGSHFNDRVSGVIPPGVGDKGTLTKYQKGGLISGCLGTSHTEETIKRFARLKPGEVDSISKSRRLDVEGLCPTLRAGTGPERGSFQAVRPIHPRAPRVISPREAARLQGFPDWFLFDHTKWHAFRQIGNSVSPLVSEFALCKLRAAIGD